MPNRTIPVSDANAMIAQYLAYMTDHKVNMNTQTHSASFTTPELLRWMNEVKDYTDEFRICLGVYPGGEKTGRMTTIIWPYKDGQPATHPDEGKDGGGKSQFDPYNEGGLTP